ncbi:MAG: hypothetical protein J0H09_20370 [Burkholderiales bacterium]|nr:hypothetical protein [Burkholderiales bacterium]
MLTFELTSNDRLHFASKAIYRSDGIHVVGILILTDRRLYFGAVGQQLHIDMSLQGISSWFVDTPKEEWLSIAEKERLCVAEKKEYIFALDDSAKWARKLRWRMDFFRS